MNMKNNNNLTTTIIVAVVVAAVAFFGGIKYQQSHVASSGNGGQYAQGGQGGMMRGQNGGNGAQRTGGRGGATVGTVLSQDANSITIKLQDGSSKIVNVSATTTISKTDTAAKSDLKTGDRVAAIGATNSDGSITAQNIQLNPMFRMGSGGQGVQPSKSQ